MPLSENDWEVLLGRISDGNCTPFLGAGACYGALPLGGDIARYWVKEFGYPFEGDEDLARVAQFVAVNYDRTYPKERLLKLFDKPEDLQRLFNVKGPPDFRDPEEPHGVLADLPLPVYMTTNYDDFLMQALTRPPRRKAAKRELCRWNALVKNYPSVFDGKQPFEPSPATPVVFHLHGHSGKAASLVLTEDDYLEFLANMSRDDDLLPPRMQEAMAESSFLFIGYRMADWNFRVLFQGLRPRMKYMSVAVLLPPKAANQQKAQDYLEKAHEDMDVRIYWGTAREFCAELRNRWQAYEKRV